MLGINLNLTVNFNRKVLPMNLGSSFTKLTKIEFIFDSSFESEDEISESNRESEVDEEYELAVKDSNQQEENYWQKRNKDFGI